MSPPLLFILNFFCFFESLWSRQIIWTPRLLLLYKHRGTVLLFVIRRIIVERIGPHTENHRADGQQPDLRHGLSPVMGAFTFLRRNTRQNTSPIVGPDLYQDVHFIQKRREPAPENFPITRTGERSVSR